MSNIIFHHIGYATKDINKSRKEFEKLGYIGNKVIHDLTQNVDILFLYNPYFPCIELVSPFTENNPINRYIKEHTTPYHMAFMTDDFDNVLELLRKNGYILTSKIKDSETLDKHKFVFLYKEDIGLIELIKGIIINVTSIPPVGHAGQTSNK